MHNLSFDYLVYLNIFYLPKVVMTMQIAKHTAINIVSHWEKGAGQHSGPHGVESVPETTGKRIIQLSNLS